MTRWCEDEEEYPDQVANALDSFVDLTPVSQVRAEATRANWLATLPGQTIPLIGEDRGC